MNECTHKLSYDEKYDAKYCATCNGWREEKCHHKTCEFCSIRPDKPLSNEQFSVNLYPMWFNLLSSKFKLLLSEENDGKEGD